MAKDLCPDGLNDEDRGRSMPASLISVGCRSGEASESMRQ